MAENNKKANLTGPLETRSIDFALLPNFERYKTIFAKLFLTREYPEATDAF